MTEPGKSRRKDGQPGAWTGFALDRLDAAGYRRGGSRRRVIEYLADQDCAASAPEIDRRLNGVGRASVYRTLEQLEELGLVQRVDLGGGSAAFERVDPTGHHHHHLICRECGAVIPFEDEELEGALHRVAARHGFRIEGHDVSLRGICSNCG